MQAVLSNSEQHHYQTLLHCSNSILALSAVVLLATILVCYPFEQWFSLPQLIAGHLSMLLSATLVKLSYIGRCIALYGLKKEVR